MDDVRFKCHPVYDKYAASRCGKIIHIKKQKPIIGYISVAGYLKRTIGSTNDVRRKSYREHRFAWETYNGLIPDGMVIDHKNDIKTDHKLENLQLLKCL